MAVNKVVFGTAVLIDISDSTVTEDMLPAGVIAYDKAGNRLVGKPKQISFNVYDYSAEASVHQDTIDKGTTWYDYATSGNSGGVMYDSGEIGYDGTPIYLGGKRVEPIDEIYPTTYDINH